MNNKRPILTDTIAVEVFKEHYWLKSELVEFCRRNLISSVGLKMEISDRIDFFLKTGQILIPKATEYLGRKEPQIDYHRGPFSRGTIITSKFKRTSKVRAFFVSQIGTRFHFTIRMNNFFRENIGATFNEAIEDWLEEERQRKNPDFKSEIVPQCKYNQYIRDYMANNKESRLKEAIDSWNIERNKPGIQKYENKES